MSKEVPIENQQVAVNLTRFRGLQPRKHLFVTILDEYVVALTSSPGSFFPSFTIDFSFAAHLSSVNSRLCNCLT